MNLILEELSRPFPAEVINFRVGQARGSYYTVLSYLDARMVAARISSVSEGWNINHGDLRWERIGTFRTRGSSEVEQARVSVDALLFIPGLGTRSDVGEEVGDIDDIKLVKTVYSDALKRAAVHFGVGAYLYDLDMGVIPKSEVEYGRIKEGSVAKLRERYQSMIEDITLRDWQVSAILRLLGQEGDAELAEKLASFPMSRFESLVWNATKKTSEGKADNNDNDDEAVD